MMRCHCSGVTLPDAKSLPETLPKLESIRMAISFAGISNENTNAGRRSRKVILDSDVHMGSRMDGCTISRMHLPKGCLVISILHQGVEIVPGGSTVLHAGDQISVVCSAQDSISVDRLLDEQCRQMLKNS